MRMNNFQNNSIIKKAKHRNWKLCKLTDVLSDETRKATKVKKGDYLESGDIPIIDQGASLIGGYSDLDDGYYDDVPFIVFGDHTRILKYIEKPSFIGADGVKILNVKLRDEINIKYLYYFLKSIDIPNTGYNRHFKFLKEIIIPIPTLKTQDKIVSLLDRINDIIEKREQQIEALSSLKQSIYLDMFGDPVINKKDWQTKKLEELGSWSSGGTPARKNVEYYNGTIPWLSSGELNDIYTYFSDEHITEVAIKESSAKIIPVNSILLGMYDSAGLKSTINKMECSCNQAIAFSFLDNEISSTEFVYFTIQLMKDYLKRQQRGVRQKNFNLSMIKKIKIISPPLNLQTSFEKKLIEIQRKESVMKKGLDVLTILFESLTQKAFNGELFND